MQDHENLIEAIKTLLYGNGNLNDNIEAVRRSIQDIDGIDLSSFKSRIERIVDRLKDDEFEYFSGRYWNTVSDFSDEELFVVGVMTRFSYRNAYPTRQRYLRAYAKQIDNLVERGYLRRTKSGGILLTKEAREIAGSERVRGIIAMNCFHY